MNLEEWRLSNSDDFANRNIKVGAVIRYFVTTTIPPKLKRLLITGISGDRVSAAVLFFNSEINPNIFFDQKRRDLNLKLEATEDRAFIDKDCYIDCSKIEEIPLQDILNAVTTDVEYYLGEISQDDLMDVLYKLKGAFTIPNKTKRKYGLL